MATNTEVTPEVPVQEDKATLSRRQFLTKLSVGLSGVAAAIVGLPVVGFLLGPLFRRSPQEWRGVGAVDKFQVGQTIEVTFQDPSPLPWAGVAAGTAAWLRREGQDQFRAFAVNCTHLGCPVRWLPDASLFMCPCHGGVFYQDGKVAAGPPPHPLSEYKVRVNNGQVEILTSPTPIG